MYSSYLDAIRTFEGFAPQAQWDYAQLTNGYGTRAKHAGEVIDRAEADRRFEAAVANARAIVERHAAHVDEGTKAALTSLTFNAGDSWARSGLGDAVSRGALNEVRAIFQQYNKAGGEVLPGLVSRRAAEALWIGNPQLVGADVAVAAAQAPAADVAVAAAGEEVMKLATAADAKSRDIVNLAAVAARGQEVKTPVSAAAAILAGTVGRNDIAENAASDRVYSPANEPSLVTATNLADIARLVQLDNGHELLASQADRRASRERAEDA